MFFILLLAFILGGAIGSFLNVVIDRATRGESILGRSYCDHCKATLSTLDLIPVVSFVTLGAKCRYCRKPLSWQYPAVEALCALLFTVSAYVLVSDGNFNLVNLFYYFLIVSVSIIVAVVDYKFSLIPTTIVFFASLAALIYDFLLLSPTQFLNHVLSAFFAAFAFLILVVVTRRRGMGEGDVVLAFLMGMILGPEKTVLAVFTAFFSGAVVSLLLIAFGKKRFGQTVPFAPFLIFGLLTALFWGDSIVATYLMLY